MQSATQLVSELARSSILPALGYSTQENADAALTDAATVHSLLLLVHFEFAIGVKIPSEKKRFLLMEKREMWLMKIERTPKHIAVERGEGVVHM